MTILRVSAQGAELRSRFAEGSALRWFARHLICELLQSGLQVVGFESEGAGLAFVDNAAGGVDQVEAIGPGRVGGFGGIAEFVEHRRNFDAKFAYAGSGNRAAFLFIARAGKNDAVFDVALHLPDVARVRLRDVDYEEPDFVLILVVKTIESGDLPSEGWSSVTAEDEDDWLFLACERRKLNLAGLIDFGQREIGGGVANVERTAAGLSPHGFEGKNHERDRPGDSRHHMTELLGRLAHHVVDRRTCNQPEWNNHRQSDDDPFSGRLIARIHVLDRTPG
jgi:hypothetical protein